MAAGSLGDLGRDDALDHELAAPVSRSAATDDADPVRLERRDLAGVGVRVGDERVDSLEPEHEGRGDGAELRGVGEDDARHEPRGGGPGR